MQSVFDIGLGVLYAFIIFIGILYYVNRKYVTDLTVKKMVLWAFAIKVIALFTYAFVYKYYYGYGDTLVYHKWGLNLWDYINYSPSKAWEMLKLSGNDMYAQHIDFIEAYQGIYEYFNGPNYLVIKTSFLLGIPGFMQYLPTGILFSTFAFIGSLKAAEAFSEVFPKYKKSFFIAFLFIPSMVFWSSGINKDALVIGFINLLIYALIHLFILTRVSFWKIVIAIFAFYFAYSIKSYIPIVLVPTFMIYAVSKIWNRGRFGQMRILRFFTATVIIILFVPLIMLVSGQIIDDMIAQQLRGIIRMNIGQGTAVKAGDSSFDLGIRIEDLQNPIGIIKLIPKAILITLYRPGLWEVRNPLMLISALENFFFLGFTALVLIKCKILGFIPKLLKNKELIFFLLFTLILCIPIGISAGNFGSIVRYKIPILPYFFIFLVMLNNKFTKNET